MFLKRHLLKTKRSWASHCVFFVYRIAGLGTHYKFFYSTGMQVSPPHYISFVYRIAGLGTRYTLPLLRPCRVRNACFSYGYLWQTKPLWATMQNECFPDRNLLKTNWLWAGTFKINAFPLEMLSRWIGSASEALLSRINVFLLEIYSKQIDFEPVTC